MSLLQRMYREVDAQASREDHAERPARAALLTGVLVSAVLLGAGLAVTFFSRESRPNEPPTLLELFRGIFALRGVSLIYLGLLILTATPILRVSVMVTVYLRRHERFMTIVSLVVLFLLVIGLLIGTG
jgi:uncharacterized membrane protein